MTRPLYILCVFLCLIDMRHGTAVAQIATDHFAVEQDWIVELGPALSPFQHVRFCQRYPTECEPNLNSNARFLLDSKNLGLLDQINRRVNAAIFPSQKIDAIWAIAPRFGDCNDYAVTKRHELLQLGLASSAVRLSVVKTTDGTGHLVVVVATTRGDVVLDNLTDDIRLWEETDYKWLKIQSKSDPHYWVGLKSPIIASASLRKTAVGVNK
jgi:predicted transglutaminase-like cysteine proteinase